MQRPLIVVLEAEWTLAGGARSLLHARGYDVRIAPREAEIDRRLAGAHIALIVASIDGDLSLRGADMIRRLREALPSTPVIAAVRNGSEDLAIAAFRAGAADYLREPISSEALAEAIAGALRPTEAMAGARGPSAAAGAAPGTHILAGGDGLIGASDPIRRLRVAIQRVAATPANVLLTGETGTGKELAAQLIHANSPRRDKPFVSINCAAIPEGLLESELFGFEKGAFTGAQAQYAGKLQLAHDGTTLFDEIGDMSLAAQAKILRAIETKEVYRLGGTRRHAVDIRMIAATNQNLEQLVADGRFRKDLFFRLNVVRIALPPLRERRGDIPLLLAHYVRAANRQFRRDVEGFTPAALDRLARYDWPGNIRELMNLVEGIFVDLPARPVRWLELPDFLERQTAAADGVSQRERDQLLSALLETNWNKSRAAEKLSWSRMTVYRKMAKYQLTRDVRLLA